LNNNKVASTLLALSMFFTGASGLVNEYVLSTVSIYILGSSIEQFSITIALMLGMMGIGSGIQKFIGDENLIQKFITIEIFLAIIGSFAPIAIYAAFGYMENNFALVYYSFVMIIGFLIGFEIPFIIRINEKYIEELKSNLSVIIAADYIGSLVGALIWVYYLLPSFNLNQISFIVSGVNFFIALISLIYFIRIGLVKFNIYKALGVVAVILVLSYGYNNVTSWEINLEQKLYEDPIVETKTTKYQHLTLTHNNVLDEYRLYINGNIQFSSLDEERYHEMLVHPVMAIVKDAKKILVLGGGDGLAIRELNKYKNIESITLVDLDPGMVQFAKNNKAMKKLNKGAFENAKITIIKSKQKDVGELKNIYKLNEKTKKRELLTSVNAYHIDADLFLKDFIKNKYDVIIIDFPDPSSIELNKLYTKQFYMKLKRVMHKGTRLVIQSTSPYHAKESFLCIGRTLEGAGISVVPVHINIPSFGDWGWYIGGKETSANLIKKELLNIDKYEIKTGFLTTDVLKSSMVFGKGDLTSKDKRVNSLMEPVLLNIYTKNSWLYY